MSRYFVSPPAEYARNWANGQNLVESTKIESQILPSKKLLRKEKREKKKEKKLKKEKKEKSLKQTKQVSDEFEQQLEKSCLTEEHEQHNQVGYLSDGSQNSKKRAREASPSVESNIEAARPLRVRFVFHPRKEAEVVSQVDRVCSTSGTELSSELPSSVSGLKTCDHEENLLSTTLENDKIAIPAESNKSKKHKPSKEARYNTLFTGWVPPCISLVEDNSNRDDWLFGTSQKERAATKHDEGTIMNVQTSGDSFSLPRARFLPEVGIYSLPYTVLF